MADYRELMRMIVLRDIYNRMSDEEKKELTAIASQTNGFEEITRKLDKIDGKLDTSGKAFAKDFAANVVGNYAADASIYILSRLLKMVK